jgi:hypothetical protein
MARFRNPLDHVRVAAPCESDWDQMIGDERVRFCGQCSLNVYNLSSMTRSEAESLIARTEGRLCVRFYRRRDGSIITKDCPVGLGAIRRRVSYLAKAIASMVLGLFAGLGVHEAFASVPSFSKRTTGIMVRTNASSQKLAEPELLYLETRGQLVRTDPVSISRPRRSQTRAGEGSSIKRGQTRGTVPSHLKLNRIRVGALSSSSC